MVNYYYFLYGTGCSYSDHTTLNNEDKKHSNQNRFDKFGNYVFPTDLVTNTPNTVTGTSSDLSFLNEICVKILPSL